MSSSSNETFPTPKFVEGGCVCGALRYRVDFPENHDFKRASGTCQCSQCRKQTGSLFLITQHLEPSSAFRWTSPTFTLRHYAASAMNERGFCVECGGFIYWRPKSQKHLTVTVGSIDSLYLLGEGAEGTDVPAGGYGLALANGGGHHLFCANEIAGVTDNMPMLARGTRFSEDDDE